VTDDVGAPVAVGHEVGDFDLAVQGDPGGDQDEGVLVVAAAGRDDGLGGGGRQQPAAVVLLAEQGAEDRGRIEPRKT
jgi:hypothetical protein